MTDYDMRAGGQGASPLTLRLSLTLNAGLAIVDRALGIDTLLAQSGSETLDNRFDRLRRRFDGVAAAEDCMHLGLNPTPAFDPVGLTTQAESIAWLIRQSGAQRVLEIGCGAGFNTLKLAAEHPGVRFTGLELMPRHRDYCRIRARDRGLTNAQFLAGAIDDLPGEPECYDLIFAVEALGHAQQPDQTARSVARALAPGGRFVQFGSFRHEDVGDQPGALVKAMMLFDTDSARRRGFRTLSGWRNGLGRAGLSVKREQDLTANVLPSLLHLQRRAIDTLAGRPARAIRPVAPSPAERSLAADIVAPMVYCGPGPQPMPALGTLRYAKIVSRKPR